ncbi:hypothetical protein [Streptomyces peucetius]|uniref:Secreted protein n=1 Tax=Streptomyces peucetius TaxID=1950 RepID=A0ABY6HZK3_STRPE|nr:hypothetical protein [Streptomyces peucetius]UYQ60147.1 hypothetical protein OGH68_00760 [Streptomyces peucetius]
MNDPAYNATAGIAGLAAVSLGGATGGHLVCRQVSGAHHAEAVDDVRVVVVREGDAPEPRRTGPREPVRQAACRYAVRPAPAGRPFREEALVL